MIEFISWLVVAPPTLLLAIHALEVLCGLIPRPARPVAPFAGSVAVLIPAHNEAAGIARTIVGLRTDAKTAIRILVVADNCTDDTAALARAAGAEAIERFDSERRGKGYALAFGRDTLALSPPDVVVVVDADCRLLQGSLSALGAAAVATGAPAQAIYLLTSEHGAAPIVQISNFAFLVKNLVRSRGLSRLGGCVPLTGSGMAFPWAVFAQAPLATGDITEDLALGIALVRRDIRPQLAELAEVRSDAASLRESLNQRRRWEHGFIANALRHALPLVAAGLARPSRAMVMLGLHLLVPPLALLLFIAIVALALSALIFMLSGPWLPGVILGVTLLVALLLTGIAWALYGRATLRFTALLQAPLYIIWKIPLYLGFVRNRETTWRRTDRSHD